MIYKNINIKRIDAIANAGLDSIYEANILKIDSFVFISKVESFISIPNESNFLDSASFFKTIKTPLSVKN